MLYNRTCRICGKEFGTNVNNKITCSPECSQENQRRLHRKKYLRNNPGKGTGSRTQSLCFSCKRAWAKPFEEGGCDKVLYGTPVYNRAIEVLKEPNRKNNDSYMVKVVLDCDYFIRDYGQGRNVGEG